MLENAIARRYASAFFSLAQERNALDQFEVEMQTVVDTIAANADLKAVIDDQLMAADVKKGIIEEVFAGQISSVTIDFIKVIMDKRRENYLTDMNASFVNLANAARNIQDAEVTAAHPLTEDEVTGLQAQLAKLTGKTIRIKTTVKPEIVGGIIVRIGDQVIDGSVTRRLEILKETLTQ